ncbi:MAG: hypothetical protein AAF483_15070 [Planctomycetota bacterium]
MNVEEWATIRGNLCHQWLANHYLQQLRYWVEKISNSPEDLCPEFEEDFMQFTLTQWVRKSRVAHWVVEKAHVELSPKSCFLDVPLARLPKEIREPLAGACEKLWLVRTAHLRELARKRVEEMDDAYERLICCLRDRPRPLDPKTATQCVPYAKDFLGSCAELKRTLEDLPRLAGTSWDMEMQADD